MAVTDFVDQMGRTVQLPHPPRRIVSLVPSQTELLFDLGLDDEIIGVTQYCIHPREKVAGRTDGTARRYARVDFVVDQRAQGLDQLQPNPLRCLRGKRKNRNRSKRQT